MKLFFIGILFTSSLFSWSEKLVNVKGVMDSKTSGKFVLDRFNNIKGCYISIARDGLSKTLDSFIESNWEQGEVLRIAVPSGSESISECSEEIGGEDYADSDVQVFSDSVLVENNRESASSEYSCDSPEYIALKARVHSYNERSTDGSDMNLPSCSGGSLPDCDSEERIAAEAEARRTGSPIGPCMTRGYEGSSGAGRGTR